VKRVLLLTGLSIACACASACARADDDPGTTIMGDRDSALGLVLAPWKDETRAPEMDRPPAMQEAGPAPLDEASFSRTTRYHAAGRAYRSEKLQRNR
jgi:hypothetical protein